MVRMAFNITLLFLAVISVVLFYCFGFDFFHSQSDNTFLTVIVLFLMALYVFLFLLCHCLCSAIIRLESKIVSIDLSQDGNIKLEKRFIPISRLIISINNLIYRVKEKIEFDNRKDYIDSITLLPNKKWVNNNIGQINLTSCILFEVESINGVAERLKYEEYELFIKSLTSVLKNVVGDDAILICISSGKYAIGISADLRIEHFVSKIRTISNIPFDSFSNTIYVDFWFGSSSRLEDRIDVNTLLDDAKLALYEAKRNMVRHIHFDSSIRQNSELEIKEYNRLKNAVIDDQFVPYFQPIVDLDSGVIVGVEALARWVDPDNGVIGPLDFIPLAEDVGLIDEIGLSILKKSLMWFKLNCDSIVNADSFSVHINISIKQLMHVEFVNDVKSIIDALDYKFKNIHFEFTESIYMETKQVMDNLNNLREFGIKFSVDDFGTGYSSFSYLRDIEFASLKIDRTFVCSNNIELLKGMITMGISLGCDVIAEGVETREQCGLLKSMNCKMAQGYLFSPPLPGKEFSELLRSIRKVDIVS
ncbi:GGDEF domain-containing protein [Vibrio sinensis]|uniref:GGDEF domain-containing protein n=1 Tax=Vibrio sinensis TaxID=2302434 RepID=A0A3A6QJ23_9VIBR|nr:GGDEF domain-containing phosphodiesterase [Vibrio sinensis]RJX70910.1 GGDEF domain-containing protein [Vibrio sinensis]